MCPAPIAAHLLPPIHYPHPRAALSPTNALPPRSGRRASHSRRFARRRRPAPHRHPQPTRPPAWRTTTPWTQVRPCRSASHHRGGRAVSGPPAARRWRCTLILAAALVMLLTSGEEATEAGEPRQRGDPRHIHRINAERDDPTASQTYGHLSEIMASPRHAALSPAIRAEQLQATVLHYLGQLDDGRLLRRSFATSPFVREGRTVDLPAINPRSRHDVAVSVASPVASRRHAGETPAVLLVPGVFEAEERTRPAQVIHLSLYFEGEAFVESLLSQSPTPRKRARGCVRSCSTSAPRRRSRRRRCTGSFSYRTRRRSIGWQGSSWSRLSLTSSSVRAQHRHCQRPCQAVSMHLHAYPISIII